MRRRFAIVSAFCAMACLGCQQPTPPASILTVGPAGAPGFGVPRLTPADRYAVGTLAAPSFRLTWDATALHVAVRVHDLTPAEAADPKMLFTGDSVEFFVARDDAPAQYYQLMVSPGADPAHPAPRHSFTDHRTNPAAPLQAAHLACVKLADGYELTADLPWSNVNISPAPGAKFRFQVQVNDVDAIGAFNRSVWFPSQETYHDPHAMYTLALGTRGVLLTARGEYQEFRRVRIALQGDSALAGKTATVYQDGRELARAAMESVAGGAVADVALPLPPLDRPYGTLTVRAGTAVVAVKMPEFSQKMREDAFVDVDVKFSKYVFGGKALPTPRFDSPLGAEDLIGPYTMSVRYFDQSFQEVRQAEKPGRYGAVVDIRTAAGKTYRRYTTLYRLPEPVKNWGALPLTVHAELPQEFGVSPRAAQQQRGAVDELMKWSFLQALDHERRPAVALAALFETGPDDPPVVERTGAWSRDAQWWSELKGKLGDPTYPYLEYLPAEAQAGARHPGKKWPLIVFLHGSGERGTDLQAVAKIGLPAALKGRNDFPFIVISPQCPPRQWWSPSEINRLLDEVLAKYPVDPDRVYLTGLSMGGYGSWNTAMAFPDRFAAVAPIAGVGDKDDVARIKDLPFWVFHGDADNVVPLGPDAEAVKALRALHGRVRFTVYPGVGHDSWTATYRDPRLFEWLLAQRRGKPAEPAAE